MINIKELRIGNFILLEGLIPDKEHDGEHYNEFDHAENWGTDLSRAEVSWDIPYKANCICWEDEESLIPIRLNPGWFLKFGFKLWCGCWEYRGIKIGDYFMAGETQYAAEIEDWKSFEAPALKFVHQLQNLVFALTGEELEVKR